MCKKIVNTSLYIITITGTIILLIGVLKVLKVKSEIESSAKEVEELFDNNSSNNVTSKNTTIIEVKDSEEENEKNEETKTCVESNLKAIGLITFEFGNNYKVAIYDNVTQATLKKGAGRLTGSAKLNGNGNCILYRPQRFSI